MENNSTSSNHSTHLNRSLNLALCQAAYDNNCTQATTLIGQGACINGIPQEGIIPLHIAIKRGHIEMVNLLLKAHADPNFLIPGSLKIETCLHQITAAAPNSTLYCIADLLLDHGANQNIKNQQNKTPLDQAIHNKDINMIHLLLGKTKTGVARYDTIRFSLENTQNAYHYDRKNSEEADYLL